MATKFDNILGTIGNTPLVRLSKLAPAHVNVFAKLEAFNPMGSVKDRLALGIIEDAERRGTLRPGQTVIEATSGNTGIGLAMVCAVKGYPLVVTMAENFSLERRKMMRFLGAKVVLTPAALKGSGMLAKAVELAHEHDWFLCRQFENEANADIHSRTTAEEILAAFDGEPLDYWVTGCGTGGTLKGVARVLKARRPQTQIVVCEPDNSPTLASGIAQARDAQGNPADSHPSFRPHLMQGWTPDFIPKLTEDAVALEAGRPDRADQRRERARLRARARARGGHLHGHHGRRDHDGRARDRERRGARREHRLHAARHGRALPDDAAVREHRRRHDRRGTRDLALDAERALRCADDPGAARSRSRPRPRRPRRPSRPMPRHSSPK